jgi:hypothetical protein
VANRQLKIAYICIATTSESHTAGKGTDAQTGAITTESQADAARHELWHIEIARAAAAKANELEAKLIAQVGSGASEGQCGLETSGSEIMSGIDRAVMRRYHQLREKYNLKLHEISSASVRDGVWRDNPSDQISAGVSQLLAELRSEPVEEEGVDLAGLVNVPAIRKAQVMK